MIDFKYHITSLVAVFLALGIGILIGSTMVGGDVLVEQQKLMVDQLEVDFRNFREQNRLLRDELDFMRTASDFYKYFAREALPAIVTGRLAKMKLAVFSTGGKEFPEGLLETLRMAEGKVVYSVSILSQEHLELVNRSILQDMIKLDGAVIIGGQQNVLPGDFEKMDLKLINTLRGINDEIIILGTERSDNPISVMVNFQKNGVTGTVDNIETEMGQAAMVFSLAGLTGNYGVKNTANQLLPSLFLP